MTKTIMDINDKSNKKNLNNKGLDKIKLKFPQQENTIDILERNINAGFNTILYGLGGFGKSQIVKAVCKTMSLNTVVVQCYRDMPIEAILGPLDMVKFSRESKYEINFNESPFMSEGVLILEEFMDLDPEVASALKDVIEEKGYRSKDGFIPYNVQAIVALGNVNPRDVSGSDSLKALYYDRFISHIEVKWVNYSPQSYVNLFKTKYSDIDTALEFLARLCSEVKISPRAGLQAAELLQSRSDNYSLLKILSTIHYFDSLDINNLLTEQYGLNPKT